MLEDDIIDFMLKSERLKRIPRSGWLVSGVHSTDFESVAAHSWGSSLITLLLSKAIESSGNNIDIQKALTMALLHDISESEISDIPRRATELGGIDMKVGKRTAENEAFREIIGPIHSLLSDVENTINESSLEKRVVRAADLLDMLFHAVSLEESGVDPQILDEFFMSSNELIQDLNIPLAVEIFNRLQKKHKLQMNRLSKIK